ncbi:exocyst complex component 4 [Cryptococcus deuterogattii MMRL2647]|nr:exocyst complex component 4 [Cryptococcus deuterogattii MMRL2647]
MSRQPSKKYTISNPQPLNTRFPTPYNTDTSPPRPARSRMRDAPQPPRNTLEIPPLSPISPLSPSSHDHHQPLTADVFADDRAQRMEMRAQMSAAAQQASQPFQLSGASNTETMRNVVGAFMSAGRQHEQPSPARRPHKSEARMKKSHREEVWEDEEGGEFGEIDSAMRQVKQDWPFVMESDFSPSSLALSLLSQTPSPSLPQHPSLSSFLRLHEFLSAGLRAAVQAHSKSFAASLPSHRIFLDILEKAQEQVRKSKQELKAARDGFAGKGKTELTGQVPDQLESLVGDKRFLQASLILVRSIETINKPELREIGALSDLRSYFVTQETTIAEILIEELHNHIYLKTFYSDSRWKPYTPGRVDLPIIGSQAEDFTLLQSPDPNVASPNLNGDHNNTPNASATTTNINNAIAGPGPSSKFSRYLSQLSTKPSTRPMLQYENGDLMPSISTVPTVSHHQQNTLGSGAPPPPEAGSHTSLSSLLGGIAGNTGNNNPETYSYIYIENLLEALAVLGRLGQALDTVAQRAPGEIFALVDGTLDEVEERTEQRREEDLSLRPQNLLGNIGAAPSSRTNLPAATSTVAAAVSGRKRLFSSAETSRIEISLGAAGPPEHAALLKDLFWTLYSKLAAVLEGHRVMYEVSRWISSRPDFKDSTTPKGSSINIPVLEMWRPVQQEIRTLLSNYLSDDRPGSRLDRNPILSINEVLRDPKVSRDKSKPMFRFNDSDSRAIQKEIKPIDESVQQALRSSVPGLVNIQSDQPVSIVPEIDDRFSPSSGRYRTLVPPNAFNVTTLFQPTLAFIHRASAIVPPGFESETQGFSTVLEDFVVKVFLRQLDEKVTTGFQKAVSGYDAYQVDRGMSSTDMKQPPLKSSVRVMALIHSLCIMLQTTPFHRENYSRLIVGVIVQYYQQCSARFKDLVSQPATFETDSERPMVFPAVWAQREDITKCLSEMRSVPSTDRTGMASVSHKEIRLEMELLHDRPVSESNLINSNRKLEALGNLSQSLRWFIDALLDLQSVSDEPISPEGEQPELEVLKAAPPPLSADSDEPQLPLTRAMAQRYQAIIQTYEQLAEMVLNAIRLEIRCRVMCNISASMQKGDFRLESEALEPDSDILDLNTSLMEFEELAQRTISPDDHSFIFRALGQLVDYCLIAYASKYVKGVNAAGVRKIKRDILSLQQTLQGIAASSDQGVLSRAAGFWDLYEQGPKKMLEDLKNINGTPPYTFEDYNTMLKLQCKSNTDELNTYLIDLHALSMDVEGWDLGED